MEAIIEVKGLRKRFGPVLALDGMTFTVRPGRPGAQPHRQLRVPDLAQPVLRLG